MRVLKVKVIFCHIFPGFVFFVFYLAKISGERLPDHWSSGSAHVSQRLIGELIGYPRSGVRRSSSSSVRPQIQTSSNVFSSETAWPIKAEFYMEPHWERRTKVYINGPGLLHMKNTVVRWSRVDDRLMGLSLQIWANSQTRKITSSPKGNDRSPESQHVIIKTNSDMNQGMLPCCKFAKNNYLQYQQESCQW